MTIVNYEDEFDLPPVDYDINKVPKSIKDRAEGVRDAIFGKQNKEFLAQSVEISGLLSAEAKSSAAEISVKQNSLEQRFLTLQQETTNGDYDSAPEIIDARGGKATLGARLDDTTAQLAQKAKQSDLLATDMKIDNFNNRVNEIITTPAEGIAEQEIIDARQGKQSLGANLSEIKKNVDAYGEVVLGDYNLGASDLEIGGFNPADGSLTPSTIRGRTKAKYRIKKGTVISLTDYTNQKLMIIMYNYDTGNFIRLSSWMTSDFIADADYIVRVGISHVNDSAVTQDDLPLFASLLKPIETSIRTELNKHKAEFESFRELLGNSVVLPSELEIGGFSPTDGSLVPSTIRGRTKKSYKIVKGTVVGLTDYTNQKLMIVLYDYYTEDFISLNWFTNADYISDGRYKVKIAVAHSDDSTVTQSDIELFASLLKPIDSIGEEDLEVGTEQLSKPLYSVIYDQPYSISEIATWEYGSMYLGVGSPSPNPSTIRIRTKDFIPVKKGAVITLNDPINLKIAILKYNLQSQGFISDTGYTAETQVIDEDCYIKILIGHNDDLDIDLSEGDKIMISHNPSKLDEPVPYLFFDEPQGIYEASNIEVFNNPVDVQINEVYARYDSLMSDFPDYITKQLLGSDDFNLDVYQYTFSPVSLSSNFSKKKLKVILTSGLHGDEKSPVYSLYNMLKSICHDWRTDDILKFLRFNIEFVVVPISNPSGFNDHTRVTRNNVNLNANFTDIASTLNRQTETKILMKMLRDNTDAEFIIDFHNMYFRDGYLAYGLTDDIDVNIMINKTIRSQTLEWQARYPLFPQSEEHQFGYTDAGISGTFAHHARLYGIKNAVLEIVRNIEWQETWSQYDELTVKLGTELLTNTIKGLVKTLK